MDSEGMEVARALAAGATAVVHQSACREGAPGARRAVRHSLSAFVVAHIECDCFVWFEGGFCPHV